MKVDFGVKVTVTASQLAEIYGVTRQTVCNWRKRGMPSHKPQGLARRFDLEEVETWMMGKLQKEA